MKKLVKELLGEMDREAWFIVAVFTVQLIVTGLALVKEFSWFELCRTGTTLILGCWGVIKLVDFLGGPPPINVGGMTISGLDEINGFKIKPLPESRWRPGLTIALAAILLMLIGGIIGEVLK